MANIKTLEDSDGQFSPITRDVAVVNSNNVDITRIYQEKLVSGTNIKTINGTSLLGSGDIAVAAYNKLSATNTVSSVGYVVAGAATSTAMFLKGNGTWATPNNTTYAIMGSSAHNSDTGYRVLGAGTNTSYFLRGDGTWQQVSGGGGGNNTYSVFGPGATNSNVEYVINGPTVASGHTGSDYFLRGDGYWSLITTYGALSASAHDTTQSYLVKGSGTNTGNFLRGDGTWQPITIATTSTAGLIRPTESASIISGINTSFGTISCMDYTYNTNYGEIKYALPIAIDSAGRLCVPITSSLYDYLSELDEPSGEQYIDAVWVKLGKTLTTEYYPTYYVEVQCTTYPIQTGTIYQGRSSSSYTDNFSCYMYTGGHNRFNGKTITSINASLYLNTWITIKQNKTGLWINGTKIGSYSSPNTFTSLLPLKIYTYNRIKEFKVFDNGTPVLDFVPKRETSTGNYGLYDTISGIFYGDATNTGEI